MTRTITLREANQTFARVIREVEAGQEFVITRNGEPVARLTPVGAGHRVLTPEQEAARERLRAIMSHGYPLRHEGPLDRDALHRRGRPWEE